MEKKHGKGGILNYRRFLYGHGCIEKSAKEVVTDICDRRPLNERDDSILRWRRSF